MSPHSPSPTHLSSSSSQLRGENARLDAGHEPCATTAPTLPLQDAHEDSLVNSTRPIRTERARHGRVRGTGLNSSPSHTPAGSPAPSTVERQGPPFSDQVKGTSKTPPTSRKTGLSCSLCGATFSRQEHLTRHVRSHADERPFACAVCGRRFTRRDTLKRHEARHE
ncbi:hypothetical protein HDK77DRAFT_385619, partial [Phyllosticta capitalensis]